MGSVWKSVSMKFQKKIRAKGGMQWSSASRERERRRKIEMIFFFFFFDSNWLNWTTSVMAREPFCSSTFTPIFLADYRVKHCSFVVCESRRETSFTLCFLFFACRGSEYIIYIYIIYKWWGRGSCFENGISNQWIIVDKIWMGKKKRKIECFESFDR